ncbi:glycosyltransferase family 2 protein [Natrialbaceae archaeon A-arb3/5]
MDLTVAIVTCDRHQYLNRLLSSLAAQTTYPEEIIVVNNGRDEATETVVDHHRTTFDQLSVDIHHLARSVKYDLPGGRNAAIERADSDVICFLDDDTVTKPTWLEGIEDGFRRSDDVVAVGGPSIATDETLTPVEDLLTNEKNLNCMNKYGEENDQSRRWIPPEPVRTDRLQGSNMAFSVDILEDIGGFDPGYEGYPLFEDADVLAKLWKRDETVIYHPKAMVYHLRAVDGGYDSGRDHEYWYWFGRNSIRYRKCNFSHTYPVSLFRLLFYTSYHPYPIWKQLAVAVLTGESHYLWQILGYADGILKE